MTTILLLYTQNLVENRFSSPSRPALDAGFGLSFATPHSEFCENSSRPYFLRALRVKQAVLGSREVREGKKSAKGLRYTIGEKLEEAQPRVEHGATGR